EGGVDRVILLASDVHVWRTLTQFDAATRYKYRILKGCPTYVWQAGTFNGNAIACAAGLATLAELRKPGMYQRLFKTGTRRRAGRRVDGPGRRARPDAQARRHPGDPNLGSAALRSVPDHLVQDAHRAELHPQPAPEAQGRAERRARDVPARGRPGRVVDPAQRDDVRLQAPSRCEVAQQAAGQRTRA